MGQKYKEIKAVLYIPESESGKRCFEKKICDFYAAQVEKNLHSYNLTKQQKLEVLQLLMDDYTAKA